jgi:putative spermidine/putrescine transport system permease protein
VAEGVDRDQGLSTVSAGGPGRKLSRFLYRHPGARLTGLLGAPLLWLLVAYLGSLVALLLTSLYRTDSFTGAIVHEASADNFRDLATSDVYRAVGVRTLVIALLVTVIDIVIALPIAFYLAKVASRRVRSFAAVAVLLPLWASYLVKAYAWRTILTPSGGVLERTVGWTPGFGRTSLVIVLAYLWLPYMILPIYAGLERLPDSLLEASADLGGKAWRTFRSVVVPLVWPAVIAGSIFTFSLSLGDYIAVNIVGGKTQVLGSVVYQNFVDNLPFAAAFSIVPVVVMIVYLLAVRRTGAFENL